MQNATPNDSLFHIEDGDHESLVTPSPYAGGPWNPDHQHGGAVSGLLAIAAAIGQTFWLEEPLEYPRRYLLLWCGAALISAILASIVVARRTLRCPGELSVANAMMAVKQFAPSLVVGAIAYTVMPEDVEEQPVVPAVTAAPAFVKVKQSFLWPRPSRGSKRMMCRLRHCH